MVCVCAVCGDKFGVEAPEMCDECQDKLESERIQSDPHSDVGRLLEDLIGELGELCELHEKEWRDLAPKGYQGLAIRARALADAYTAAIKKIRSKIPTEQ